MAPYWILFSIPALMAILERHSRLDERVERQLLVLFSLLLIPFIGLRYEVGADWFNYMGIFDQTAFDRTLPGTLEESDPGYGLLNWIAGQLGQDIRLVNTVCAIIFAFGFHRFCLHQPRPWLAATVAVPYLIIVVAMGYSRQGAAIGFLLAAFVALADGALWAYFAWILLAASFHRTALVMIPLAALAETRNRSYAALWVGLVGLAGYQSFLSSDIDALSKNYLEAQYGSEGAQVRVAQNVVPGVLLLAFRSSLDLNPRTAKLWTYMALGTLLSVVALFLSPSSTAVDRLALYLIPIQLFVYSRIPDTLIRTGLGRMLAVTSLVLYSGTVLYVWLVFSDHAEWWTPYENYLFR